MLVQQPSSNPHERIGRYEVLRKIATGGMAELFLAKQVGMEGFEKVVAIKRILAHLAFDEEFINMFRDEARIVAKLSHPNIVQIYDLGKSDDTYFIAMEYIPGRNLSSVAKKAKLKGEKLPPEFIARCIAQACEGLYYAHTRQDIDGKPLKIVHRDVSPQNIILAFSGGVKLVDFGIAKAATKIAHTRAGVLKGKYAYMSPEQIRGDEVDARADLFAVGIVLYELLCGRRPFEKENSIQTLKAIVQEPHVDCRVLNSDIPDGLASIIDKALSKSAAERWQSAQELQLALEDLVASTGRRCNNIVISKWVTDLFSEELSRDRGGTMVFKGVGEVILPDLEDVREEKKEREPDSAQGEDDSAGISVELESKVAKAQDDDSNGVPLERGRGGGSVNLPPAARRPIAAPSTALGDLSGSKVDASGRQKLIEEGVIGRPIRGDEDDDDGGWNDDKTALAADDPPKRSSDQLRAVEDKGAEEISQVSQLSDVAANPDHDFSEPEIDRVVAKGPALYDDSKTEFGPDLVPEENIEQIGDDEEEDDDAQSSDLAATWIPSKAEAAELKAAVKAQLPTRDHSQVTEEGSDELPSADDADDPWEDKTIGYPDGRPPVEDVEDDDDPDAESTSFDGQGNTNEMPVFDGAMHSESSGANEVEATMRPPSKESPRRGGSLLPEAQGWGNLEAESKDAEVDLWDDKTATNDAYLDDEMLASPMVQNVDVGDPTINAMSLPAEVLRAMGTSEDELSGEATMSGINLADQQRRVPVPQISDDSAQDDDDESDDRFGDAVSMDRTIAGMAPVDDEDEDAVADFSGEGETRRSLDEEPELPVPRSNKNIDADSRTVAGVTSDFIMGGLPPPEPTGTYDQSEGFEIDLTASQTGEAELPKPKPKRGAGKVGAIKLAKAPVEPKTPTPAPKPAETKLEAKRSVSKQDSMPPPSVRPKSKRFDFSEERTEAGESGFEEASLGGGVPDPESWEVEPSNQGDREPTDSNADLRAIKPRIKAEPTDPRAAMLIERAFDDFSLDDDVPPKADPPKGNALGMKDKSSIMSVKIPPPLNGPAPSSPGSQPAIGSTNVPPANLSLAEMLSIPIGQGSTRAGFQVYGRGPSNAPSAPPPAASGSPVQPLRGRPTSIRQIRETVRPADMPQAQDAGLRLPMPDADGGVVSPSPTNGMYPAGPPLLDFASMQPEPPPARARTRIWLLMGVLLALALAAVTAVLVVPALVARDPQLTIRTMPDGADIYLNGQLQPARTPATLGGLQPGVTYELKLVREGYEPISKAVPIPKATRNILVQIPLRPLAKE